MFIQYIKTFEEQRAPGAADQGMMIEESAPGVVQQKVVEWYLEQNLDSINSEEDALIYEKIGHSVI